jgi:polyisoprenoid-binding protein YceI
LFDVNCYFSGIDGVLSLNEDDVTESHVEATIDASSITTRDEQRDAHLRSADFFDVEKFPTLGFTSTDVKTANGDLTVSGNLTIHGITRPVVFTVEGPTAPARIPGAILESD